MRARTTFLLLFLVIALGASIVGIERFLPSTRALREMKKGPAQFDRAKVTQIELDSSGGDGVSLASDGVQWWVRRPFNDLADPEKVARLLTELAGIGWIQRVYREEFDDAGWTRTGLDKPRQNLRLMAGGDRALECRFGAPSPIEGAVYLTVVPVKTGEEPAHYVAKTTLPDLLKAAPQDWRDGRLLRLPANLMVGLKLTQTGGQIELVRQDEKSNWMLVKPLNTRGGKERVNELVATLLTLAVKDAVEPASSTTTQGSVTGASDLTAQEMKVSVTMKGQPIPFEITLKKPAKDAVETTAKASHRKPVFTVMSKSLANLWAQPNDLRDRMLARVVEDAVSSIEIAGLNHLPVVLKKESNSWFVERKGALEPANGDRVYRFFHALNTHAIAEFTADTASNLAPYGLDTPFLVTTWQEGTAKAAKLLIGKNTESTEFFAKYEDEPSVYRIDASILPSIPQDSIKWKGLGVMRFTQFALRRISISLGTEPPRILNYNPTSAQWTGELAGRDITPQLDRVKADRMAMDLAKFSVQDWSADITDAIHALQNPALRVVVTLGEPGTNTGPTQDTVINFAPTHGGMESALFFGQVQGSPDVFYISRTALLQVFGRPPLKE